MSSFDRIGKAQDALNSGLLYYHMDFFASAKTRRTRQTGGKPRKGEKLQKKLDRHKSLCYTLSCSERFGGIAQLGERLTGSQEVSGSIPLISTRKSPEILRFQDSFFAFAPFDQGYRLASPEVSPHLTCMRVPLLRIRTHSDLTHQEGEKAAQRTRGRN